MKKRFKPRKKNTLLKKLIYLCLLSYIFFNLSYNLIYNIYLKKLDNKTIISHIISNTKNNTSNKLLKKYQNPSKIIKDNFILKEPNPTSIDVVNNPSPPSIYIYSTHETESYSDKYLELYNITPTVKTASYILNDYLTDLGISSNVEKRSVTEVLHNHSWSYRFSYEASREIILNEINSNNYKLIIDLHRDSSSLNHTIVNYNGKNYAKILFVIGAEHQNYLQNNAVAEKLAAYLEQEIPGITRGITKKSGEGVNGIYNQDINPNMVLIELGGQYNEIEELNNTIEVLSHVILKYLEGE